MPFIIVQQDITQMNVDAIVNAAHCFQRLFHCIVFQKNESLFCNHLLFGN